jgi:hypothetical protein
LIRANGDLPRPREGWTVHRNAYRLIGVLAVSAVALCCATSEQNVAELVAESAEAHGCVGLGERPGDLEPDSWFVDLAPFTGGSRDVAYLCRSQGDESLLLVVDAGSPGSPWRSCSSGVPLDTAFEPEGISVVEPGDAPYLAQIPLNEWKDESDAPGPAGLTPTAPILDTSWGIAGWAFYCHEGRWLRAFIH